MSKNRRYVKCLDCKKTNRQIKANELDRRSLVRCQFCSSTNLGLALKLRKSSKTFSFNEVAREIERQNTIKKQNLNSDIRELELLMQIEREEYKQDLLNNFNSVNLEQSVDMSGMESD